MSLFLEQHTGSLLDSQDERDLFDRLAKESVHPTGVDLATQVMRDLISLGRVPNISPVLKAVRAGRGQPLEVDTEDNFNQTFLKYMQCEGNDVTTSTVSYLGGCTISLVEIVDPNQFTEEEYQRLNPVPLPALRVVFELTDT